MKKLTVLIVIIATFAMLGLFWWQNGLQPADPLNKTPEIFIIKNGQGVKEIAKNLKQEGLIRDQIVFFLYARFKGIDKQIQAGDFRLNPSMKALDIAENLTHGTLDIWVTIPEGLRAEEIADILKEKMPAYEESWRTKLKANEGYLFPDTYLIPRDADADMVINLLKNTFEEKFNTLDTSNTNLTKNQIIIVASLIEREARHDQDRPLVASVILNRFNIGMKLDLDATIQYALGYQTDEKRWWKKSLTLDDIKLNSSYNTYRTAGLPPTPISNPGLESLKAAINPADTDYLFYITDSKGINHYAKTIEEHNANIKKYPL